jgi:hypothetical protein
MQGRVKIISCFLGIESRFFPMVALSYVSLLIIHVQGDYSGSGNWSFPPTYRTDYKFRLIDANSVSAALTGTAVYWPSLYQIDVRINPCVNSTLAGGRNSLECCSMTGEVNCQDSIEGVFAGGDDLQVAYMQNALISTCKGTEFEDDIYNCGTFLEIHRAVTSTSNLTNTEAEVLSAVSLNGDANGAFSTTYLSTRNAAICTGNYELWWVVRTRSGPYVQLRKPFTVIAPSC